jgi:hypothetical protein
MDNKNSLVKKSQRPQANDQQAKAQQAKAHQAQAQQAQAQQAQAHPLGFHYEIWDGDNTGWTKVTNKRRHKK